MLRAGLPAQGRVFFVAYPALTPQRAKRASESRKGQQLFAGQSVAKERARVAQQLRGNGKEHIIGNAFRIRTVHLDFRQIDS